MQKKYRDFPIWICSTYGLLDVCGGIGDRCLLPALDIIGVTIGTTEVVDNQLLITMIFLGLGFGPLVLAPFR
jgi:DHA1 family bicyclomycin/chloramphenicol resistance-like MFS transporter